MPDRTTRLIAMIAALFCATSARAATATLDCRKAHDVVSQTICASPEYVAMDREIAALTDRAKARLSTGESSQLAESEARYMRQRKGCTWAAHNSAHPGAAIDECVRASLEGRVKRLRDVVARSGDEITSR